MKKFALFSILLGASFALAQSDAPTVEGTLDALQGGLTAVPVDAAVANIEGWQTALEGSDDPVVQGIATKLGQLSSALQADAVDRTEVSDLLTSLGSDTLSAAEGAGDAQVNAQLVNLGNLLLEAGTSLASGAMSGGSMSGGMMSGGAVSGGN